MILIKRQTHSYTYYQFYSFFLGSLLKFLYVCNPSNRAVYVYAKLLMIHVTPITGVTLKLQQPLDKALVLGEPKCIDLYYVLSFLLFASH